MKLFVKLMVLVLIAALAGPFFIKGPDGRPLMQLGEAMPDWQRLGAVAQHQWSRLTGKAKQLAGGDNAATTDGMTRIYKSRDAAGNWVYSNEPPASGEAEVLHVDPNVNIIPATPAPRLAPRESQPREQNPALPAEPGLLPPVMDPGRVKQLIDDARGVQEVLDERAREMDEASSGDR